MDAIELIYKSAKVGGLRVQSFDLADPDIQALTSKALHTLASTNMGLKMMALKRTSGDVADVDLAVADGTVADVDSAVADVTVADVDSAVADVSVVDKGFSPVVPLTVMGPAPAVESLKAAMAETVQPVIPQPRKISKSFRGQMMEKFVAYLQLENEEIQSRQARERIETEKAALKRRHDEMRDKITKNIDAMKESAHQAKISKILGWVMVAIMLAAVLATGGLMIAAAVASSAAAAGTLAAGSALAAIANAAATVSISGTQFAVLVATAALATTSQALTETGKMEELLQDFARYLKNTHHISEEKANMWAQIIVGATTAILTLAGGIYGGGAIASAMKLAMVAARIAQGLMLGIQIGSLVTSIAMGGATLAQQGVSIAAQYRQGMADADVSEIRAMVQLIQQMLDETQEELQKILDEIQGLVGKIFSIISSQLDADKEIANKMGGMV